MAHRTEGGVLVRRAERELVQVGLADEHRAGRAQPRRDDRRRRRDVPAPHARRRGGRRPAKIDQILERDRHAVQRAAVAAGGNLLIGGARLRARLVGQHGDEGVDRRIALGDAREAAFGDRFRA